jgi:hypothetical protein
MTIMKKHFTQLFIAVFTVVAFTTNAQVNILEGSDMESEDAWLVSTLENDPSNTSSYEFGYTDDFPDYGEEGVLHFTINNTGENGAHLMFYQEVTIEKGKRYMANMAVRAMLEMNNSWFEVYLGNVEPAEGSDYNTEIGEALALGGFKWSGWEAACTDLFDGMLQNDGCLEGSNGEFIIEGEGEVTMYFGFKAGIWATETTVEFLVDNVELIDLDQEATSISKVIANTQLYPNPVNNSFKVESNIDYVSAKVYNVLGKEVLNIQSLNKIVDASALNSGMYIIELKDADGNSETLKFQKQ